MRRGRGCNAGAVGWLGSGETGAARQQLPEAAPVPPHRLLDKVEISVDDNWVHQVRPAAWLPSPLAFKCSSQWPPCPALDP